MLVNRWSGTIFADYNQFYLWDSGRTQEAPTDYNDQDIVRRIKTGKFVVVIQPERNFTVPVAVEVHDSEPPLDVSEWDHVAEASLHLPTGALQVHESTGGVVTDFAVTPGWYRVRSLYAGLSTVSGIEGSDQYTVEAWPSPERPVRIVKQFEAGSSAA